MAGLLDFIVGHRELIQTWKIARREGRLPHATLLTGPSGIGKKQTALAFAQVLLCEKAESLTGEILADEACGLCGNCLRMLKQQNESCLAIAPEKNQIKLEQAREILDFLSLKAVRKNRVVIVDQAELLNNQSANSLLKIIEEPPEGSFFFLTAPSSKHVLPTIRSRCQILRFAPLTVDELKKKSPRSPEWALRSAMGSFEKLAELAAPEEQEIRASALRWVSDVKTKGHGFLESDWRLVAKDRDYCTRLYGQLATLFRDAAYVQLGATEQVINSDQLKDLSALSTWPLSGLFESIEACLSAEKALQQNRDSQLVFDELWLEVKYVAD